MSQTNSEEHDILVPPQHALMELIDANETYLLASRGSFKSSVGLSLYNIRRVFEMPRSTGVGVGITFNNLYENTVPPFKAFLLSKGFVEDVHFTICKPPPENWPKPYQGVVDRTYKNSMTWYNGTSKQFISLRRKASANGVSAQWGDFDELKFMDEKELVDEIFPIFRGNEKYFKNCSGYLSKFFLTDKKADPIKINWILKKRDLVNQQKIDVVLSLQVELNKIKHEYNSATKARKLELKPQIHAVETRLSILRSNLVYVSEISADDVRPILGNKWYNDKRRNSSEHDWNTIYKNLDPLKPESTFYPAFGDPLFYDSEDDIDTNAPLIISADYQHTVAPIPIAQIGKLPGASKASLNYVDEVYTMEPKGLRDAVKLFCDKYYYHRLKAVYYVYDHTAVSARVDAAAVYTIVIDELERNGWTVWQIYIGQASDHYLRFADTKDWMENKNGKTFDIRINKRRCEKLIKSVGGAGARTVGDKTKKDKRVEVVPGLDQSETTHFSDAFDMTNDAVLKKKLIGESIERTSFAFR